MISICICTYNPRPAIFGPCLEHLRRLDLPDEPVELLIIDNASTPPLDPVALGLSSMPFPARIVREPEPGLIHARIRGLTESKGGVIVYVDDDNYLVPGYLRSASALFKECPGAGVAGGRCLPKTEGPLPDWFDDVRGGLAIRDLGERRFRLGKGDPAPVGAGMAVRRAAMLQATEVPLLLVGRKGGKLTSGEDNELCMRIGRRQWESWYEPGMELQHFIPSGRLEPAYLERLYEGFGRGSCSMELYDGFQPRLWRVWYLRRAFFHWRTARRLAREAARPAPVRDQLRLRLEAAANRGRAAVFMEFARQLPAYDRVRPYLARA